MVVAPQPLLFSMDATPNNVRLARDIKRGKPLYYRRCLVGKDNFLRQCFVGSHGIQNGFLFRIGTLPQVPLTVAAAAQGNELTRIRTIFDAPR